MLRYLAVASLVAPLAFAQTTQNPLIPTGISSDCTGFLQSFNNDPTVSTCLTALNKASAAFAPGASTPSSQAVTTALNDICSSDTATACPESALRTQLANFWSKCQSDLTPTPNNALLQIYDVLWTLVPFKNSMCSKDDSGNYCAAAPSTAARDVTDDSTSLSDLLSTLWTSDNGALKRRAPVTAISPNLSTFEQKAIPFLFITPDLDATKLCTTCTRGVVSSYIDFASSNPYGPGFSNSVLLKDQPALLASVSSKCPPTFLGNAIDAAGGIGTSNSILGGSSGATALTVERGTFFALAMSVAAFVAL